MDHPAVSCTVDGRGLVPPEPLVLTLEALDDLAHDQALRLLLEREPLPLYQALRTSGHQWHTRRHPDGVYDIVIWRGAV